MLEAAVVFIVMFAVILAIGALMRSESPKTVDNGQSERTLRAARQLKHEGAWNTPRVKK